MLVHKTNFLRKSTHAVRIYGGLPLTGVIEISVHCVVLVRAQLLPIILEIESDLVHEPKHRQRASMILRIHIKLFDECDIGTRRFEVRRRRNDCVCGLTTSCIPEFIELPEDT